MCNSGDPQKPKQDIFSVPELGKDSHNATLNEVVSSLTGV